MRTQVAFSLTIPPGTPDYAPARVTVNSPVPKIFGGEVVIPSGVANLAAIRLETRGAPVVGWVGGDGRNFQWRGVLLMAGPPYPVDVFGYNLDDTWPHTLSGFLDVGHWDDR